MCRHRPAQTRHMAPGEPLAQPGSERKTSLAGSAHWAIRRRRDTTNERRPDVQALASVPANRSKADLRPTLAGASHFFATFVTPSPPHTCGGEGRGEEETPLANPPRPGGASSYNLFWFARGEGIENCAPTIRCKKLRCARCGRRTRETTQDVDFHGYFGYFQSSLKSGWG